VRRCFSAAFVSLVFRDERADRTQASGREKVQKTDKKPKRQRSTAAVQTRPETRQETKAAEKHCRSPDQTKAALREILVLSAISAISAVNHSG
jgi:hypothetical protein